MTKIEIIKKSEYPAEDPVGSDPHWCDAGYSIGKKHG